MSAPENEAGEFTIKVEQPELHTVVGVTQMCCGKCGNAMPAEPDGRDTLGLPKFKATCATCRIVVDVPRMIADSAVIATMEQAPSGEWYAKPK